MANRKAMADIEKRLRACTKEDLIWIINRLLCLSVMGDTDYYIGRALNDLQMEKDMKKFDKADELATLSNNKMLEYINLISPYKDTPLMSIPKDVLEKADKALKEARSADEEWEKLMFGRKASKNG